MAEAPLQELKYAIQYRRKDDGIVWHTMAAFDVQGPAEWYYELQRKEPDRPYEYRLIELVSAQEG